MRGNHFVRQLRIIRASKAVMNGLTVAEIAKRVKSRVQTICQGLAATGAPGFPLYTEKVNKTHRWICWRLQVQNPCLIHPEKYPKFKVQSPKSIVRTLQSEIWIRDLGSGIPNQSRSL